MSESTKGAYCECWVHIDNIIVCVSDTSRRSLLRMTLDRYSSKNPLCQGWKFDLIDMAGNAELHKQNVIVSALVVETQNVFWNWRPKDFLHQLFWPRHCHLFSYITDHYSSTYWGEKNAKKKFKKHKKLLEKKNYTFTQVRSVFWLFHIGSQDERRPLDYTTRWEFSQKK